MHLKLTQYCKSGVLQEKLEKGRKDAPEDHRPAPSSFLTKLEKKEGKKEKSRTITKIKLEKLKNKLEYIKNETHIR